MWYFLAFCVTWAPSTIWSAKHYKSGGSFRLDLVAAICEPLAGFWNLLIFLSNRPKLRRKIMGYCLCQYGSNNTADDDNQDQGNIDDSGKDTAPVSEQASKSIHTVR